MRPTYIAAIIALILGVVVAAYITGQRSVQCPQPTVIVDTFEVFDRILWEDMQRWKRIADSLSNIPPPQPIDTTVEHARATLVGADLDSLVRVLDSRPR